MNASMYELILHKRNGDALTRAQWHAVISGYVSGAIPDYQVSALLMAIYFRGLTARETADLTEEMVASGDTVDLSSLPGVTVDKHSTGGVGDKTTLVLAPMLAAAGCTVAKMSGRGLGHTGGTLDKLESIPGFRTDLSPQRMVTQAAEIGLAVVAQSGRLVPADGLLYALRDVTATVDSLPLIASSIMSKKLAAGAQAMVLDVKTGSGAFMREVDEAFALAKAMVEIASLARRTAVAVVTSMAQPLGYAIGNSLEVAEAIATLRGEGPADLRELCLTLGGELLAAAGIAASSVAGRARLTNVLESGEALARFERFVVAQGGDPAVVSRPEQVLPRATLREEIHAPSSGWVAAIDALTVGEAARDLGAGRHTKGEALDLAAGVLLHAKVGARLQADQAWATIFASDPSRLERGRLRLQQALTLAVERPSEPQFIFGTVNPDGSTCRL